MKPSYEQLDGVVLSKMDDPPSRIFASGAGKSCGKDGAAGFDTESVDSGSYTNPFLRFLTVHLL